MLGTVLVVDDSFVARLSLKNILKETGLSLMEAPSGEVALELLSSGIEPLVVFLDLTMPGIGGMETLRAIRERFPGQPVIVVTADIQARTIEMVRDLGATAVVRKPADKAEVLSSIDSLLSVGAGT